MDRFENCVADCTGLDCGAADFRSRVDAREERMEAGLVGDPRTESGRLDGEDDDDASACCDGEG